MVKLKKLSLFSTIILAIFLCSFHEAVIACDLTRENISATCRKYLTPLLKCLPCYKNNNANNAPDMERLLPQEHKSTAIGGFKNYKNNPPKDIAVFIAYFLSPNDILVLSSANKYFNNALNEDFWKRYCSQNRYIPWKLNVLWIHIAFAYSWDKEGYKNLNHGLVKKAANLGHPLAKQKIAKWDEIIKRKEEDTNETVYNPEFHLFRLTHPRPHDHPYDYSRSFSVSHGFYIDSNH